MMKTLQYVSVMNADAFAALPTTRWLTHFLSPQQCHRLGVSRSSSDVQWCALIGGDAMQWIGASISSSNSTFNTGIEVACTVK